MAIFTMGDLHLSLDADKKMDIFPGWENYVERIRLHWTATVGPQDTVVLPGDISWGMSLTQAYRDFAYIDALPGRKLLLKGNHDYWWCTRSKMEAFFQQKGLTTLGILHNDAVLVEGLVLCGSRGWLFEKGAPHDHKIMMREAARLECSLRAGHAFPGEKIAFLHYPPLYADEISPEIMDVLEHYGVQRCYYGHIHSASCQYALNDMYRGIRFSLVSADFLHFKPQQVETPDDETQTAI